MTLNNDAPRRHVLTYDAFNAMCERLSKLPLSFETPWFFTRKDIEEKIAPLIPVDCAILQFAIWLDETTPEPETDDDKAARKALRNLINNSITLSDPLNRKDEPST